MARIFLTGASGYLGGEVLYSIKHSSFGDVHIVCLVRDASKGEEIIKAYPDVEIVQGDLDSSEVLEREAQQADVVLRTALHTSLVNKAYRLRLCRDWPCRKCRCNCKGLD